jgi:hypothetical protein
MYEADKPLMLLYLVNILQPVRSQDLKRKFEAIARRGKTQARASPAPFDSTLQSLVRSGLVTCPPKTVPV